MNLLRFQKLLDCRGSDLAKWPEADRLAAELLIASNLSAAKALAEAGRLDRLIELGLADRPLDEGPDEIAFRVLARLPRTLPAQTGTIFKASGLKAANSWAWRGVELTAFWPRAAALTFAAALGIAVGLFAAEQRALEDRQRMVAALGDPEADLNALLFGTEIKTGSTR